MAGVLDRIKWPQKKLVVEHRFSASRMDLRILELKMAKEILGEIFGVRITDVDEMIQNRYENVRCEVNSYEETEQWPREFLLGDKG
jgi:hypothetical protein